MAYSYGSGARYRSRIRGLAYRRPWNRRRPVRRRASRRRTYRRKRMRMPRTIESKFRTYEWATVRYEDNTFPLDLGTTVADGDEVGYFELFRLAGAYDPQLSTGIGQSSPYAWGEWASRYNYYEVFGAIVTLEFEWTQLSSSANVASSPLVGYFTDIQDRRQSVAISDDMYEYKNMFRGRVNEKRIMPVGGGASKNNRVVMKKYFSLKSFLNEPRGTIGGERKVLTNTVPSYPDELLLHVFAYMPNIISTVAGFIYLRIRIDYKIKFSEQKRTFGRTGLQADDLTLTEDTTFEAADPNTEA